MNRKAISLIIGYFALACVLLLALFFAGIWLFAWSLESGMCGNDQLATASSPNDKLKAVIFQRDCGATTGVSQQISILPVSKDLPNEPGNIFRTNMYYRYDPENPEGGSTDIEARWLGNNDLLITTHNPRAEIWQANQIFDGVNVKYEVIVKAPSNKVFNQTAR